jgi:hypothetical protein
MSTILRVTTVGACAVAMTGLLAFAGPSAAQAAQTGSTGPTVHASSTDCGYDGYVNGYATYRHCGRGSVVIEVDHFFWQTTYACMPPGVYVIPQGNVSWAIVGAEADGNRCALTQPTSIVGP